MLFFLINGSEASASNLKEIMITWNLLGTSVRSGPTKLLQSPYRACLLSGSSEKYKVSQYLWEGGMEFGQEGEIPVSGWR